MVRTIYNEMSASVAPTDVQNGVDCEESENSSLNSSGPRATGSYAEATRGERREDDGQLVDPENNIPERPLTAFFRPRSFLPAEDVFSALSEAGIDGSNISCIQRQSSGDILLTFRQKSFKDDFLKKSFLSVRGSPFALQDVDRPLTYLQVFDAPHEMPDTAIISRLSKYCDVISHRRGMFRFEGWENVQDGVRHYRVQIKQPIPSFMRFGKALVHFRYEGQPRTCRHCHQTGHIAKTCHTVICYNCEQTGHLANDCPEPLLCNICKSDEHKAKDCPFSWSRAVPSDNEARETPDDDAPPPSDFSVVTEDTTPGPTSPDDPMEDDPAEPSDEEFLSPREDEADGDADDETENTPRLFSNTQSSSSGSMSNRRTPAKISGPTAPLRKPTQPVKVTGSNSMNSEHSEQSSPPTEEPGIKRGNSPLVQRTAKHKKRK